MFEMLARAPDRALPNPPCDHPPHLWEFASQLEPERMALRVVIGVCAALKDRQSQSWCSVLYLSGRPSRRRVTSRVQAENPPKFFFLPREAHREWPGAGSPAPPCRRTHWALTISENCRLRGINVTLERPVSNWRTKIVCIEGNPGE